MSSITPEAWEDLKDWAHRELNDSAFRVNFMTDAEIAREFGPATPAPEATRLEDQTERLLLDEMDAWEERRKADLLAFAEKLGCNIYLAAYLQHLNEKLSFIADTFGSNRVVMQEPAARN